MGLSNWLFFLAKVIIQLYTWITLPAFYLFSSRKMSAGTGVKKAKEVGRTKKHVTFASIDRPCPERDELEKKGVDTMDKLSRYVVDKYGNRLALGTREIIKEEKDSKGMIKRDLGMKIILN